MNELVYVNISSEVGQKKTKSTQKRKEKPQNQSSNTAPTMYISPVAPNPNSSISVPASSNLNASFQRPKYPDPQPTTSLVAILSFCRHNTSICFGYRRSLREGKHLCFITKSRGPIGRDGNGIMQYTTDLKNIYIHLSGECVRSIFQNFVTCYSPLYQPQRELSSPEQRNSLLQLGICF